MEQHFLQCQIVLLISPNGKHNILPYSTLLHPCWIPRDQIPGRRLKKKAAKMLNVTMINRPCGIAYACSKLFMLCSAASKNRASGSHTRLLVKKHQNKLHQR